MKRMRRYLVALAPAWLVLQACNAQGVLNAARASGRRYGVLASLVMSVPRIIAPFLTPTRWLPPLAATAVVALLAAAYFLLLWAQGGPYGWRRWTSDGLLFVACFSAGLLAESLFIVPASGLSAYLRYHMALDPLYLLYIALATAAGAFLATLADTLSGLRRRREAGATAEERA